MKINKFIVIASTAIIMIGNSITIHANNHQNHKTNSIERNTKCYGVSRCKIKGKHKICKSKDSTKFIMARSETVCKKIGGNTSAPVVSNSSINKDKIINQNNSNEENM